MSARVFPLTWIAQVETLRFPRSLPTLASVKLATAVGAQVTRVDPRTRQLRSYYKADDGKLYANYGAAVKAREGGVRRFAGDALATLSRAGGDFAGWATSSLMQGVARPLHQAAQQRISSGSWGRNVRELPRVIDAANKQLQRYGLPTVQSPTFPHQSGGQRSGGQLIIDANVAPSYAAYSNTAAIQPRTPAWVASHELGHMVDLQRRQPGVSVPNGQGAALNSSAHLPLLMRQPGQDRSLLQAGVEGALMNLGAGSEILIREHMADRYGKQIARDAGVPWDRRGNALAKGTYWHSIGAGGFAQGLAGEMAGRISDGLGQVAIDAVIDPAAHAARGGPSKAEKALEKYGFNRQDYVLRGGYRDRQMRVTPRSAPGRAVVNTLER